MIDNVPDDLMQARCGSAVIKVRRIFYTLSGVPDRSCGALEVTFSDGTVFLLDAGADGDTLLIESKPWQDPFSEPISAENMAFIEESGKWSAYDVSSEKYYQNMVGEVVGCAHGHYARQKLAGFDIEFENGCILECMVESDDLYVYVRT